MPDPTLTDVAEWVAAIYELQTTDQVLAGPGGIANRQAQELANRTALLYGLVNGRVAAVAPAGAKFGAPGVGDAWITIEPGSVALVSESASFGAGTSLAALVGVLASTSFYALRVTEGYGLIASPVAIIGNGNFPVVLNSGDIVIGRGLDMADDVDVTLSQAAAWAGAVSARTIALKGRATTVYGGAAGWAALLGGDATGPGPTTGGSVFLGPGAGASKGNVHISAKAASTGGMQLGVFVGNATAAPTGDPAAGFFHWSDGGVPAWRDMDGRTVRMPDIMVLRGAYSGATTYVAGAVVTYAGGLWRAEDQVTGYAPNVEDGWWTLLAPAPTGDLGDEGKALLLGPNGASFVRSPHIERSGHVQTADATTTTVLSYAPAAEEVVQVVVNVHCKRVSDQTSAIFRKRASFRVHAGAVVQIGATADIGSDVDAGAAAWAVAVDTSSGQIRVRVTGAAAATIDWQAYAVVTPYGI